MIFSGKDMVYKLLINDIPIGTIELDLLTGVIISKLETYIDGFGYDGCLIYYNHNMNSNTIEFRYLLREYNEQKLIKQTVYILNSDEVLAEFNINNEYYKLNTLCNINVNK